MDYEIIKAYGINPKSIQDYKKEPPTQGETRYTNHLAYYTHAADLINKYATQYRDFVFFKWSKESEDSD